MVAGLVTHGFGAPDVIAKPATAVAHYMPMSGHMPGKCNGCAGDEKGLAPTTACSALCGPLIATPFVTAVVRAVPAETLNPKAERHTIGRTDSPDPYPPRPISMS